MHKGDSFKAYKTNYQTILRKYHLTQLSISTFFSYIMVIADYCRCLLAWNYPLSYDALLARCSFVVPLALLLPTPHRSLLRMIRVCRMLLVPPVRAALCGGAALRIRRYILGCLLRSPHLACTGTISKCLHPPTVHERHCDLQVFDQYSIH